MAFTCETILYAEVRHSSSVDIIHVMRCDAMPYITYTRCSYTQTLSVLNPRQTLHHFPLCVCEQCKRMRSNNYIY